MYAIMEQSMRGTPEERFWAKVEKTETCWLWTGAKIYDGYGVFKWNGKLTTAHRYAYTLLVESIPSGLQIDHLCRVRACVNPKHLEAVTQRENLLRGNTMAAINLAKTACVQGHPFDQENTYVYKNSRVCRACVHNRQAAKKQAVSV